MFIRLGIILTIAVSISFVGCKTIVEDEWQETNNVINMQPEIEQTGRRVVHQLLVSNKSLDLIENSVHFAVDSKAFACTNEIQKTQRKKEQILVRKTKKITFFDTPLGAFIGGFTFPVSFPLLFIVVKCGYNGQTHIEKTDKNRWVYDEPLTSNLSEKCFPSSSPQWQCRLREIPNISIPAIAEKTDSDLKVFFDKNKVWLSPDEASRHATLGLQQLFSKYIRDPLYYESQYDIKKMLIRHTAVFEFMTISDKFICTVDKKRIPVEYWTYELGNLSSDIDKIIKSIVEQRLNSTIKRYEMCLLDIDTHRPINGAKIRLAISPGNSAINLRDVLTDRGIERAQIFISKYCVPNLQFADSDNNGMFSVFSDHGAKIDFEITHDNYHFARSQINEIGIYSQQSSNTSLFVPAGAIGVLMSEKGTKMRVKILE